MKNKRIIGIILIALIVGVTVWYIITDIQTVQKNQEQVSIKGNSELIHNSKTAMLLSVKQ